MRIPALLLPGLLLPLLPALLLAAFSAGDPALAYTVPAQDVWAGMAGVFSQARPLTVSVTVEDAEGVSVSGRSFTVPLGKSDPLPGPGMVRRLGYLPFQLLAFSASAQYPASLGPWLGPAPVLRLARLEGAPCWLVEGKSLRLWVRKADFYPLASVLTREDGAVVRADYLQPAPLDGAASGEVRTRALLPRETRVSLEGRILFTERIILPQGTNPATPSKSATSP